MTLRQQLCSCPFRTHEAKERRPAIHWPGCPVRVYQLRRIPALRMKWVEKIQAWMDTCTGKAYPLHAVTWNLRNLPEWSLRDLFCLPREEAAPARNDATRPEPDIGWAPDYY